MTLREAADSVDLTPLFVGDRWTNLVYGPPGTGKTLLIALLAYWLWRTRSLKTRWIYGDGGFQTVSNLGLTDLGAVEGFDYSQMPEPASTLELLAEGYWLGTTPLGKDFPNQVKLVPPTKDTFESVGLWVFEGFAVAKDYLMGNVHGGFADQVARKRGRFAIDSVSQIEIDLDVGGGTKQSYAVQTGYSPYALAQTILMGVKRRSDALPRVVWTTHERASEEGKSGGERWIGPEVAGGALTTRIAGMFGSTFHTTTAGKKTKEKDPHTGAEVIRPQLVRRVYTQNHHDPDGTIATPYVANARVTGLKEYYPLVVPTDGFALWGDVARALHRNRKELE